MFARILRYRKDWSLKEVLKLSYLIGTFKDHPDQDVLRACPVKEVLFYYKGTDDLFQRRLRSCPFIFLLRKCSDIEVMRICPQS